jgi:hypothetical protein
LKRDAGRAVSREFNFSRATGQIVEEAAYVGQYAEPSVQLLEYAGQPGAYGIRLCYYHHEGRPGKLHGISRYLSLPVRDPG